MADQRQKKKILSLLSSPFRALKGRTPSSNNVDLVQAGTPSGSTILPSRAALSTESLADSNNPVICIDDPQIVNETHSQRPDQNAVNLHSNPTAIFSGIGRLHIDGGNFTLNVNTNHDDPLTHVAFQSLSRSPNAAFSASINLDNLSRRRCTDGTRVDIIAQIMTWVNESDPAKAPPVFWLSGLAGLGKTTIAYSICERLDKDHLPFVSYFCSLQLDCRNPKLLITTLCRNLAELYKPYAASVLSVLQANSNVVDAGLQIQINQLLAEPWQASIGQRKDSNLPIPIVVVDALDECDRGSEFLEELLRAIHTNQLAGIKFLVTSRLDPKIVSICETFPPIAVCKLHEVEIADVQNDIEKYLREELPEIKDEPELALLSQRAGGLFIYAATAVRFISPPRSPPSISEMRSHLQVMLKFGSKLTSHPDTLERLLVDELYEWILGKAFQDDRVRPTRLRTLHTIVCAKSSINVSVVADLASTDQGTVERVVESLHAVLFVSSKDGCVYWYHASFPDFICSRSRAKISLSLHENHRTLEFDVFCDAQARHSVLAQRCFSVMHESLHFNMCNLPSSYMFDSEVPGLNASIDETLSLTLRYASRQWATHLLLALPAEDDTDDLLCRLKDFLDNKLLFWMEAMNLIGAKFECSSLLKDAKSWLEMGKKWHDLLDELADAMNFSAFFAGSPAWRSTPHLYISALSMWNQDSPMWRTWRDRFELIPSISLPNTITIPLLTIPTTESFDCASSSDNNVATPRRGIGCVRSVAFSHDGDRIVSGSLDRSVRVWDAKTGVLLKELQGHTSNVASVAFSPDGSRIISGSWDNSVRVWDAKTGEQLRELQGHTSDVTSVTFSPGGNRIVSGSDDGSVRVWDAKTDKQLKVLQGHTSNVTSVAFSPNGHRIISGSYDESVRVWNTKTGEQLRVLQGHTRIVSSVAFSPDGNRIVSGSSDTSVRVWNAQTGEQLRVLQGHTNNVASVAFSPDGSRIITGSWDNSVRVWDAKTGEQLRELQGHTSAVTSVAFSPGGNRIVSGSDDRSVRVWDAKTGVLLKERQGHTSCVTSVAFSPDGNRIVSGSVDRSVRVWDAKTGDLLKELEGHTSKVTSVAFSTDGNRIISGSLDRSMRVWDAKTGEQLREVQGHTDAVTTVTFSPEGHTKTVTSLAFSPDDNGIISGSQDKSVRVWHATTLEQMKEQQAHIMHVTMVAFSPNGNRIVFGSEENSLLVWDAKMGELLTELKGHTNPVTSVALSPDGNQIVSGSEDNSVRVWHATTGELLRELQGHTFRVEMVAFSPDGNRIVSASWDDSVRVWDAKTGEQLRELQGHTSCVTSVAFSTDGNRIVSGSDYRSVRVWDAKTGEQLRELQGHAGVVYSVAFSPDDDRIVSGSFDNSVRVWADLNIDAPWAMGEDGWIISGAGRLVWVPSTIRNVLLHPHNTLIMSRQGSAKISFAQCRLGTRWHECYTP